MQININLVLFEELKEQPDGGAESHIVILRESKDISSALDTAASDFDAPE